MANVDLTNCIAPSFYDLHWLIKEYCYTHYWCNGGRGSTKSSFVGVEIVEGIMKDPQANAICFRKVSDTLKDSCFEQILWAIEKLGVSKYFRHTTNPLRIYYKPTKQRIYFKGLDDANKTKSIKPGVGYFKYVWFEELDEFDGYTEIRKAIQSVMRGGNKYVCFYSYNPPRNTSNWVNVESQKSVKNRYVHHSTYLDVPRDWLGEEFFIEAEILKDADNTSYEHEYLGKATGNGLNIFPNIVGRPITDEEIKTFDRIRQGIDWGFAVDPFVYIKMHHDKKRRKLYIFDEIFEVGLLDEDAIDLVKAKADVTNSIRADSAEPKSIATFRKAKVNIRGAEKGKGSINFGIKQLQRFIEIVIDPARAPNAYREFTGYEFIKNKDGTVRSTYPDENNHTIDTVRYALEDDFVKKGLF